MTEEEELAWCNKYGAYSFSPRGSNSVISNSNANSDDDGVAYAARAATHAEGGEEEDDFEPDQVVSDATNDDNFDADPSDDDADGPAAYLAAAAAHEEGGEGERNFVANPVVEDWTLEWSQEEWDEWLSQEDWEGKRKVEAQPFKACAGRARAMVARTSVSTALEQQLQEAMPSPLYHAWKAYN